MVKISIGLDIYLVPDWDANFILTFHNFISHFQNASLEPAFSKFKTSDILYFDLDFETGG